MTQRQKHEEIGSAMKRKKYRGGKEYYYFTEKTQTSEDLRGIFLDNYEIRDLEHKIFYDACGIIADLPLELLMDEEKLDLYAEVDGTASVYTADRLSYLNIWYEAEISDLMKDEAIDSIAQACAIWYDGEVLRACELIKEYILE